MYWTTRELQAPIPLEVKRKFKHDYQNAVKFAERLESQLGWSFRDCQFALIGYMLQRGWILKHGMPPNELYDATGKTGLNKFI